MANVVDILGELGDDDVEWLLGQGVAEHQASGSLLVVAGESLPALFIVLDGELVVRPPSRPEAVLNRLGRGDVVGEMSLVEGLPPGVEVAAVTDALVLRIPAAALRAKLDVDAGFAARFYRALSVFLSARLRLLVGGEPDDGKATGWSSNPYLARARFERLLARARDDDTIVLGGSDLTIEAVIRVAVDGAEVAVSDAASARVDASFAVVEQAQSGDEPVYGLNRGLGALKEAAVSLEDSGEFQKNILRSHAVGLGEPYATPVVRAMMLARLNGMARGGSGIQPGAFHLLLALLNRRVHPVLPSQGSIGMSDLAPLAHLGLALIGEGEAEYRGRVAPAGETLALAGLIRIRPQGKDALALCSANSAAVGHAALVIGDALRLLACADAVAATDYEGFRCDVSPLMQAVHEARPYSGQLATAERLRHLLAGSSLWEDATADRVVPISYRCVAQVHGAARDALGWARRITETELNSTGDNPMVLVDEGRIVANGNYHPAGLAIAFDMLAVALSQVARMATNRVLRLMVSELSGLAPQLAADPGKSIGLGVLQKTATALDAEIRHLANPASLDHLPVAGSIEDHAAMTTFGVRRVGEIIELARRILAIELFCACQAIDLRTDLILGAGVAATHQEVRRLVPFDPNDRSTAGDVRAITGLLADGQLLAAVDDAARAGSSGADRRTPSI